MSSLSRRISFLLLLHAFAQLVAAQTHTPRYNISIAPHSNGFYEYLPQGYSSGTENYPVILFVHGLGDNGNGSVAELPRLLLVGIPKLINAGGLPPSFDVNGTTHRYIIISPQFTQWPDVNDIHSAINYIVQNYRVNINRIYLTGLSAGGGASFDYPGTNSANANRLAAIVPIANASGANQTKARVIATANLPVWATHNSNDPSVNVSTTTWYINWINAAPAPTPLAKSTIFNNNIHDAWTRTYDPTFTENGLNVYKWMLQYRRFQPITASRPIPARIEAEDYAAMNGISPETSADPGGSGYNIKSIDNNDWLNYNINVPASGNYTMHFRVAAAAAGGSLQLSSGSTILANLSVPNTGSTQNWMTISTPVTLSAGVQTLKIQSTNAANWTFNWLEITDGNSSVNTIPSVNAGVDQTITGSGASLSGSGSDNDGIITNYQWTKVSGGNANIVSPNSGSTAITGMTGGTYVFRLLVTDNRGGIASDDVTVNVNVPAGYTPLPAKIQAETWAGFSGVVIENCTDTDAGKDVTYIEANDWMNYNVSTGAAGSFTLKLRVATLNTGGQLQLRKTDGTVLATLTVPKTGGLQTWQTISTTVNLPAGTQTLRIFCTAKATPYMSINWLEFVELVTGPNTPPVANAGVDQSITLPGNVQLNASASQDPDGAIISYSWSWVSGPAQYTMSSTSVVNPTLSNLTAGTYVFRVTVTDNGSTTAIDDVSIEVKPANAPPVSNAGNDQSLVLPANSVQLDASGSNDAEGGVLSYYWTKQSGPTSFTCSDATAVNPSMTNLVEGSYIFRVTVTDNGSLSSYDDVIVQVSMPPNSLPVADAGSDKAIVLPVNSVELDGSGSNDPDGNIATYRWKRLSGPTIFTIDDSTIVNPMLSDLNYGTYVFRLTVTDNRGASVSDDIIIQVDSPPNTPPVSNAGSDQVITLPVNSIPLDASASQDTDGSIASFNWTWQSGPTFYTLSDASAMNPTLGSLVAGTYVFRVVVTDNYGSTSSDEVTIIVNPDPQNQPPVANAGPDRVMTLPTNSLQLDGSASNDADGGIISINWTKSSGPSQFTISNANTLLPNLTNLVAGTYIFSVSITDASGSMSADDVTILVNRVPVSNAGPDQTIMLPANSVQLNASSSNDPDGNLASYNWTKQSGPSSFSFNDATLVNPVVSNLVAGTYVFRVTVTDYAGASSFDDVSIIVNPSSPTSSKIQAESWSSMSGVLTENTADAGAGLNVAGININDWMNYNINIGVAGVYTIRFRLASYYSGGKFDVKRTDGTILASVNVPNTGGSQQWLNFYTTVTLPAGTQTIRIQSTATPDWKINWLEFIQGIPHTTLPAKIEAENWNNMSGVRLENTPDAGGGQNVGWIDNGDWMDFNINAPSAGNYTVGLRLATMLNGGQFQIRKSDGTVLATVSVPNTGGSQTYSTVNTTIALVAGQQTIRIISTQSPAWNFNWLNFATVPAPVAMQREMTERTVLSHEVGISVSPNPFIDKLTLKLNSPETGKIKIRLINMAGIVVREFKQDKPTSGVMTINLTTGSLQAGQYILQLVIGNRVESIGLLKQ